MISFEGLKKEVEVKFIKGSGPGGQNINKRNTVVQLRWNLWNSVLIDNEQKARLALKLSKLITASGDIIIKSGVFRSQERNIEAAIINLESVLRAAMKESLKRIKTRPTYGSKQRRLSSKKKMSEKKQLRKKER